MRSTYSSVLLAFVAFFVLCCCVVNAASSSSPPPTEVWVGMTWNIKHGCTANSSTPNLHNDVSVIVSQGPSLISVEEVDNSTTRSGVDEPSYFAKELNMFASYHPTLNNFEGGEYGILTLSDTQPTQRFDLNYTAKGNEVRGAVAILSQPTGLSSPFWWITTHLDANNETIAAEQAQELLQWKDTFVGTYFYAIAGDFNSSPSQPAYNIMSKELSDAWVLCQGAGSGNTFPSSSPSVRIDYIWVPSAFPGFSCLAITVVDTQASDHCPLVATFQFTPAN
eukprot:TRINITY_DN4055_c0_g1_i1.p1 TRINITY_DN4055_c0_g1~~TRINITY_DN4055_c0_g1_i1.p1  ORF type:complete len:321 (-),score=58.10 TRINITY_DN4055_c0_g1_i1:175-1011(-)